MKCRTKKNTAVLRSTACAAACGCQKSLRSSEKNKDTRLQTTTMRRVQIGVHAAAALLLYVMCAALPYLVLQLVMETRVEVFRDTCRSELRTVHPQKILHNVSNL